jgi:hypothetical protein
MQRPHSARHKGICTITAPSSTAASDWMQHHNWHSGGGNLLASSSPRHPNQHVQIETDANEDKQTRIAVGTGATAKTEITILETNAAARKVESETIKPRPIYDISMDRNCMWNHDAKDDFKNQPMEI